jgi:hypothetical protein
MQTFFSNSMCKGRFVLDGVPFTILPHPASLMQDAARRLLAPLTLLENYVPRLGK